MTDHDFHAMAAHMSPRAKQTFADYEPGDKLHGAVRTALSTRSLIHHDGSLTSFGADFQHWLTTQGDH